MRSRRSWPERLIRFAISILITFYGGWMFMLAVGVIHHEWIKQCPTIGFGWALLLGILIRAALYDYDLDDQEDRR